MSTLKSFKHFYQRLSGKRLQILPTKKVNHEWYGSEYGGFFVCPQDISSNSVVYSFGIGEDISFDEALIQKHNCSVIGFDPTPKSINWLHLQKLPNNFSYRDYGIAPVTGEMDFFLPRNKNHVSGSLLHNRTVDRQNSLSVRVRSFSDITRELGHTMIEIVKLDIEGAEYQVVPSILEAGVEVNQILIEFHHRMVKNGKELTEQTIHLLKKHGYEIFAVSGTSEEVSFIRN